MPGSLGAAKRGELIFLVRDVTHESRGAGQRPRGGTERPNPEIGALRFELLAIRPAWLGIGREPGATMSRLCFPNALYDPYSRIGARCLRRPGTDKTYFSPGPTLPVEVTAGNSGSEKRFFNCVNCATAESVPRAPIRISGMVTWQTEKLIDFTLKIVTP
jgi:hypothetical protein